MMRAKAVKISTPGGPEALVLGEHDVRAPGPGEVLVEVSHAALNRADLLQRRGLYPAPPGVAPDVPGLEYAGTVTALGEGVTSLALGARVMGIVGGGAMCTHVVVHAREAIRVPDALSLAEAAAVPEAFMTAWDALRQARTELGDLVLVHAVASGVGSAAAQLCRARGARSIGTTRTAAKLTKLEALGLDEGLVVTDGKFADAVLARGGADVVLDLVGGAYLEENVRALALRGRIVLIGTMAGSAATLSLGGLMGKRATLIGTVMRSRPIEEKLGLARAFEHEVVPLLERGLVRPVVDAVLPMSEIRAGHERLEKNDSVGKLVMAW